MVEVELLKFPKLSSSRPISFVITIFILFFGFYYDLENKINNTGNLADPHLAKAVMRVSCQLGYFLPLFYEPIVPLG